MSSGVALGPADQVLEWGKYREWKSRGEFRVVRRKNLTRRTFRGDLNLYTYNVLYSTYRPDGVAK